MPAMSEAKASQTRPWPGSFLAMSRVYSPNSVSSTRQPELLGQAWCRRRPAATAARFSAIGDAVGVRADRPGRAGRGRRPVPSPSRSSRSCSPRSRPGHGQDPVRAARRPRRSAGPAASHSGRPAASRTTRCGRRPEPVLVERVAADRQRVVDPDRLARDLLAVVVDGQVGREVGRPARSRSRAPRSRGS